MLKRRIINKKVKSLTVRKFSKYGSKKVYDPDHGVFDSQLEHHVYLLLVDLQNRGLIRDLQRQVEFTLLPAQHHYKFKQLKRKFKYQQYTYAPCRYRADFTYYDHKGGYHVGDAKGKRTAEYSIKKKMMLYMNNLYIEEWKEKNGRFTVDMRYPASHDFESVPWQPSDPRIKVK